MQGTERRSPLLAKLGLSGYLSCRALALTSWKLGWSLGQQLQAGADFSTLPWAAGVWVASRVMKRRWQSRGPHLPVACECSVLAEPLGCSLPLCSRAARLNPAVRSWKKNLQRGISGHLCVLGPYSVTVVGDRDLNYICLQCVQWHKEASPRVLG